MIILISSNGGTISKIQLLNLKIEKYVWTIFHDLTNGRSGDVRVYSHIRRDQKKSRNILQKIHNKESFRKKPGHFLADIRGIRIPLRYVWIELFLVLSHLKAYELIDFHYLRGCIFIIIMCVPRFDKIFWINCTY